MPMGALTSQRPAPPCTLHGCVAPALLALRDACEPEHLTAVAVCAGMELVYKGMGPPVQRRSRKLIKGGVNGDGGGVGKEGRTSACAYYAQGYATKKAQGEIREKQEAQARSARYPRSARKCMRTPACC